MNIYIQTIMYKTIFHLCDKEIADTFLIASCNYNDIASEKTCGCIEII